VGRLELRAEPSSSGVGPSKAWVAARPMPRMPIRVANCEAISSATESARLRTPGRSADAANGMIATVLRAAISSSMWTGAVLG